MVKPMNEFLANILRAKRLLRQGWVDKVSGRIESIAEHSFGVAAISLILVKIENPDIEDKWDKFVYQYKTKK